MTSPFTGTDELLWLRGKMALENISAPLRSAPLRSPRTSVALRSYKRYSMFLIVVNAITRRDTYDIKDSRPSIVIISFCYRHDLFVKQLAS